VKNPRRPPVLRSGSSESEERKLNELDPRTGKKPGPEAPAPDTGEISTGPPATPEIDPASPAFDILEASPSGAPESREPSGNIVAEIVDQITEKQARAARRAEPAAEPGDACSFCLEESVATQTPYRVVLKCATDDAGTA
jgi:hypothetical protein